MTLAANLDAKLFQSTLPHGSDVTLTVCSTDCSISIHAPSRERQAQMMANMLAVVFQSTLPHGSDELRYRQLSATDRFQSTLPHGSDSTTSSINFIISLFQSTLPHGSDCPPRLLPFGVLNFNPRSLTGATR